MDVSKLASVIFLCSFLWKYSESVKISPICQESSCTSLNQFAQNLYFYGSDVTLELLPGNHKLTRYIHVVNTVRFVMKANSSATISCNNPSVLHWFGFMNVLYINISGINFVNCGGISFVIIHRALISASSFIGAQDHSDYLYIKSTNVTIHETIFENNTVDANIKSFNSSLSLSNILATNCKGIAILYIAQDSIANANNCTFMNNNAWVIRLINSNTSIRSTTFMNNTSYNVGAIYATESIITLNSCKFANNQFQAISLRSSTTSIYSTTFTNNTGDSGGAIGATYSRIMLNYCSFFLNTALANGGALQVSYCHVDAYHVTYSENSAHYIGGGAISSLQTTFHLMNNTFQKNYCSTSYKTDPSGGALRFTSHSTALIEDSTFFSNRAIYGGAMLIHDFSTVNLNAVILQNNSGLGGPLFIERHGSLISKDSIIEDNIGGIVYASICNLTLSGSHLITNNIGNIQLLRCSIQLNGTTLITNNIYPPSEILKNYESATQTKSPLYKNSNGVINIYNSEAVLRGNLHISKNNMAGVRFTHSTAYFYDTVNIEHNKAIKDKQGGGIYTFYSTLYYYGSISIANNTAYTGGGIHSAATVHNIKSPKFTLSANSAMRGGGLYIELHSILQFFASPDRKDGVRVEFSSNSAFTEGGAMYVNDPTYFTVCNSSKTLGPVDTTQSNTNQEHECFFQVFYNSDNKAVPSLMAFNNNSATRGKVLYGGLLDRCIIRNFSSIHSLYFFKNISSLTDDSSTTTINSDAIQICLCTPQGPDCSLDSVRRQIFRGQNILLNITAVDENMHSVGTTIYAQLSIEGRENNRLSKGQSLQEIGNRCTVLQYNVFSSQPNESLHLNALGPCNQEGISRYTVDLVFNACPAGFQQSATKSSCQCHSSLNQYTQTCDINTKSIERLGEFWVDYANATNDIVIHPHCPYDYCYPPTTPVYINLESPEGADSQCAFNRSGTLCGACKNGYSLVLGSSKCKKCSNKTVALIIPIAVAGLLLVALILLLNLTVDVGTINGLILYANIIYTNQAIFYPLENSTKYSLTILAWLNLDLGIETCFYDGLDFYWRIWLELTLIVYLLSLAGIVLILKYKVNSYYTAKLLLNTNPAGVLATTLLLIYTKLLRTITVIVSYTAITYPGETKYVWLADSNLLYLYDKHLVLFLLAFLLSTYIIFFTILITTSQWTIASSHKCLLLLLSKSKLKMLLKSYNSPYYVNRQYWTGILLLLRIASVLIWSATTPTNNRDLNLMLLSILIFLLVVLKQASMQIYTNWKLDLLETLQLLNIGLLTTVSLFILDKTTQTITSSISAYLATFTLISIITFHVYTTAGKLKIAVNITSFFKKQHVDDFNTQSTSTNIYTNDEQATSKSTMVNSSTIVGVM